MFHCQNCGEHLSIDTKYCPNSHPQPDRNREVAVLLIPEDECSDPDMYLGKWQVVWTADENFSETLVKAGQRLKNFHRFGLVVLFNPASLKDNKLYARMWVTCDIFENLWPEKHGARILDLANLSAKSSD